MKETMELRREDAVQLLDGNMEVLLTYDNVVANKAYVFMKKEMYLPTVLIDYDREAYYLPIENIRITFDKKVRASTETKMFSKNVCMHHILNPDECILEVKYNQYLPQYITNILSSCTMQNSAVSKYAMARTVLMNI